MGRDAVEVNKEPEEREKQYHRQKELKKNGRRESFKNTTMLPSQRPG